LSIEQKYQMLEYLYPGAEAWGFQGEIWTCARIRKMIEQQFGVTYNRRYIARIMKELNWSSHKPKILSTQRDENEIQFWKNKTWSNLKKSDKREKDSISPR
jgi:transposase